MDNDTAYVTGANKWGGERIEMFVSNDLENWQQYNILKLPGFGIFNTSICKADDKYVLMFEIDGPAEEAGIKYTARFATSPDLENWTLTPLTGAWRCRRW